MANRNYNRVLVAVHVEPAYEHCGCSEELALKILRYSRNFDKAILVTTEYASDREVYYPLIDFKREEWLYGFDADYYKEENPDLKEGIHYIKTSGHEYSEIVEWMNNLSKHDKYVLVGGALDECLLDVYQIFQHLDLKVKIHHTLTF